MDHILELFETWALNVQAKQMSTDEWYCELEKQSKEATRAFCDAYPDEMRYPIHSNPCTRMNRIG